MKKIIISMIEKVPGGKSVVAGFLGMSEACLNNRLYQTKGQRFTCEELIAVQQTFGLSDYTDEICRLSGGVFVPVAELDTLDNVELSLLQIREAAARGLLFETLQTALEDGEINRAEEKILRRLLHSHLSATSKTIESVIALNSRQ
ncbi:YmfL family putative regulatory protein [Testudinibacter sp. TR-2022]|uniref:YmfL family putative regulatory protein n=1 Tax=Testudinibacter sp. TR-2022 TaxID=2585029 RepID=UPI00111985DC|nr:YmfL family putative regulatory protein [Testudinibacter sp. TR-2022]TNH06654.1 hypothetical protein FHQ30_07345 [Pasteurellaceae bacterium Phil11]TNH24778.1 hypothetical protein FHQ27_09975 [Testudinibacter sp. TR-2022]TNH25510.1 hypothetical protein FHQ29_01180 [Testudinibacter sp. TR-2022]